MMNYLIYNINVVWKNTLNKELYSILPQNTRTKNTCKGQVGDTTIVLNEKDINNYSVRPDRIVPMTETNINGDGTYLWDREVIVSKNNVKLINEVVLIYRLRYLVFAVVYNCWYMCFVLLACGCCGE